MYTFHKIFYAIVRLLIRAFLSIRFGYTCKKAADLPEQYIVLANHTTDYDPLFVASSFPRHMYFVSSEHVARWGFVSKLLIAFLDPIFRYKGSVASSTVKMILQRLRRGANVCLFAEGNRSWDGSTGAILPSTGKLVKKAGCGLVTYKITGGYFVSPRWSASLRRGPVHGQVVNVYTAQQLADMTAQQIYEIICRDLQEDAYARQIDQPKRYKGKNLAESLEYLLCVCPQCGSMDTIATAGDTAHCTHCGMQLKYDEYGMLHGGRFSTVKQLSDWQSEQLRQLAAGGGSCTDADAVLTQISHSEPTVLAQGAAVMNSEALTCGDVSVPLASITNMDIYGKRGLVFTADGVYYELKPKGNTFKFLVLHRWFKELAGAAAE